MNPELLEEARRLWSIDKKIDRFNSRYNTIPFREAANLLNSMQILENKLSETPNPQNGEEFYESEFKRRLSGKTYSMETYLSGNPFTLNDMVKLYGLDDRDLKGIEPWLAANKEKTLDAIERMFSTTDVVNYELGLSLDIPRIRQQAEGFAATQIANYHQKLGGLIEGLTDAGIYLYKISPEASAVDRSYFNHLTRRLGISIGSICFELEDGTIQLRERELLTLIGHEGMGHALQRTITDDSELPFFAKEQDPTTIASEEAITQHYEKVVFDSVKDSKKVQKDLHIADTFDLIYQEEMDIRLLREYNLSLFYYSILVLADKSLGEPRDPSVMKMKRELISQYSLDPRYAMSMIENNKHNYDMEGNFYPAQTSELRYASKAVNRALEIFANHGINYDTKNHRSHIDMTFLTGYFTPTGFEQKAQLVSEDRYELP